ncbi:lipase family protein [Rhodococcus sp. IEGM 1341]|uniref:lipase family protein n=1 Tax=Rhodococcus sp. IEGM 1341 TaxID=3047090 RepID=UPI0024B6F59E|nr:lipase family protein [Rhodococcus sp. IEGM 1341]MDI9928184.1 lipase family protein [Rhodococcus sp. IEGM 1341]
MRRRLGKASSTTSMLLTLVLVLAACGRHSDEPSTPEQPVSQDTSVCSGPMGVGSQVPEGAGTGDLIKSEPLNPVGKQAEGFPVRATVWRILYVSMGVDETDLQLVCGMAAIPESGPRVVDGKADILAWSHGTVGLDQRCLPSSNPEKLFWGPMPGGIGAVGIGNELGEYEGTPDNGALQYALDQGWSVAATDYQPNDTYVVGRVAAANVLDSVRALAQLVEEQHADSEKIDTYEMVTWGHSQGGHAALWAGQMADTYYSSTSPSKPTPTIELAGVVGLAPASTFVAAPGSDARGLADWEMHKTIEVVGLPIPALELQIGPALFSYIFGSWSNFATSVPMSPDAALPAFPGIGAITPDAILTAQGQQSVRTITSLCLETESKKVQAATAPYRDARTNQMLVQSIWNLPDPYTVGEYFPGGLDAACAAPPDEGIGAWCDWITWNMPGPRGTSPYPEVPMSEGKPVPILIGQGMDDSIIHCMPAEDASVSVVPPASDCMSSALFDDLSPYYCDASGPVSTLHLLAYRKDGSASPASHLSIPGQLSAADLTRDGTRTRFAGSPVQEFMSGAFASSLTPGCVETVVNSWIRATERWSPSHHRTGRSPGPRQKAGPRNETPRRDRARVRHRGARCV